MRSTTTQLLVTLEHWTKSIDDRKCIDVAYLDFSKAFDTISHKKLIQKLSFYGISAKFIRLFENYLSNRKQFVSISNHTSPSPMLNQVFLRAACLALCFSMFMSMI